MTAVERVEGARTDRPSPSPRVLHVIADGRIGGGVIHVLQIIRGLADRRVFGVATQPDSFLAAEARRLGAEVFSTELYPRLALAGVRRLGMAVRVFRPDLIHVHGGRSAAALSAARASAPILYTVHGYHFVHGGGPRAFVGKAAERISTRRFRHVVFVSTHDAAIAARYRLVPRRAETQVIHNGVECVDTARLTDPRPRHVGFIGRFVRQKDPVLFVETVARLPLHTATMIGDGELREAVTAAIERHGLHDRVRILGARDNARTRAELHSFGALLVTSRWEPLGIVALEAFCAGVPVIAPRVGGISEAVVDGETGLLVERTPEALAEAVRRVESDPALRRRIVANGRRSVLTHFSEQQMLRKLDCIYERLAAVYTDGD